MTYNGDNTPSRALSVFAVMEHVEHINYTDTFLDSLWATEELANAEVRRLVLKYQAPMRWDVEEYTIHFEARES